MKTTTDKKRMVTMVPAAVHNRVVKLAKKNDLSITAQVTKLINDAHKASLADAKAKREAVKVAKAAGNGTKTNGKTAKPRRARKLASQVSAAV